MDIALTSVEPFRAGRRTTARGRSDNGQVPPEPRGPRQMTEQEIVEQNNRALAHLRTQMRDLGV